MTARRHPRGLVGRLAAEIAASQPSVQAQARRLDLARRVAVGASAAEPVCAALVVGSTALRRWGPDADLDLVLILKGDGGRPPFERVDLEGVAIEIERLTEPQALEVAGGAGWVWELRAASRLACGVAVLDRDGVTARLRRRAAARAPDVLRWEATLRAVYLGLAALGNGSVADDERGERFRGILDNLALLALLAHPRRYQKPKWVLADLLQAGQTALAGLVLDGFGIGAGGADAVDAVDRTRGLVDAVYGALGLPAHAALIAMGHAPRFAEASYVSRTLDDARSLAIAGRPLEARYVAAAAARLAAALPPSAHRAASLRDGLAAVDAALAARYAEVFVDAPAPRRRHLEAALACADDLARRAGSRSGAGAGHPVTA